MDGWRRALAGSGMPDTLLASGLQATASWLDLTHAHPSGLAQLFAGRPTRLSSLFREHDAHAGAWRQARAIRASALVLSAQRGVQGCCLAIGVASWRPKGADPLQAPIVLRGCSIRPRGAGDDDFDLDLEDAVLINPELVRELVETYGIPADTAHLAALAQGAKGFDPRPVYSWLEERCRSLRAFRIERNLVLATFAAGSGAVLADLDAAVPAIAGHRLLSRVAAASGPAVLSPDIEAGAGDRAARGVDRSAGPGAGKGADRSAGPDGTAAPGASTDHSTPRGTPHSTPHSAPRGTPHSTPHSAPDDVAGSTARDAGVAAGAAAPGIAAGEGATGSGTDAAPVPTYGLVDPPPRRRAVPSAPVSTASASVPRATAPEQSSAPERSSEHSSGLQRSSSSERSSEQATAPEQSSAPEQSPAGEQSTKARQPSAPERSTAPKAGSAGEEAGDSRRLAVVGRLAPRGTRPVRPPSEPDPAEELVVLDCDPAQRQALAAALRGENVVIEGPPGAGATHTLAAAIAGLVAAGRRVLVLSPRRASTEALLTRLEAAGVGDLVLDLRDGIGGRPATRTVSNVEILRAGLDAATSGRPAALPTPGRASADEAVMETIRRARDVLDGSAEALHEVRRPWGISAYDAMVALAELTGRPGGPTSRVRLPDDVLARLDGATRERLRVHLHSAAAAGAFTLSRADTRWFDARITTDEQARRALEAALVLRTGLGRAKAAMDAVTTAAGLRPASDVRGWLPLLELLLGVRSVVDSMAPHLYQQPLDELADAVAPRSLRPKEAPGRGERRRLRRQAHALVRPGVHVPDLFDVLVAAGRQRQAWRRLSAANDAPRVVPGLSEAEAAVRRVTSALAVLSEVFADQHSDAIGTRDLLDLPLADLQHRVLDLAGDAQGALGQPRRANLRDGLARAGLGALVDDLHTRRVGPERIDAEFDLVWWSSVRDRIVRADPRLARHDRALLRQAGEDLRAAETARIAAGASLVRAAVLVRAAKVVAVRPGQVGTLRQELGREDGRPRMADLVRRCGEVLAAVTPVWMMSPDTVAACLPPAEPGAAPVVDTVVVDDAGHIGLPEVIASLARGAQVIVAGDRRRLAPPDRSTSVIEALAPFSTVCRLDRDHRARDGRMLVPLAPRYPEGWRLTPGVGVAPPLSLEVVPDGVALPPPGEELPVSSDAEVQRVVDLVERHARDRPEESLAVVTIGERHAERIEESLRQQVTDRPALGRWLAEQWQDGRAEPFVIRSVQRVLGVERDAAIVSIGLARTPHGRVLHRFGVLDGDKGAAALTTAVSRARRRTSVVCCFTADDLIVDRLRSAGSRLLRDVLLAAGGRGTAGAGRTPSSTDGLVSDLRDRLAAAGLPVQVRVGDGEWPLDVAVADPREPGRMLVAVDVDGPAFSSRTCGERERSRPMRWERAGWSYCKVSAMDLFADPALEVDRIRAVWHAAMAGPLPSPAPDTAPRPAQGSNSGAASGPARGAASVAGPGAASGAASGAGPGAGPGAASGAAPGPASGAASGAAPGPVSGPARSLPGPRRVTDLRTARSDARVGSAPGSRSVLSFDVDDSVDLTAPIGPEDDDTPAVPERSRDDSDEGWGGVEPDDRDEQLRRERPPHWD